MQSISFYRFMTKSEIDCIKCLSDSHLNTDRINIDTHSTATITTESNHTTISMRQINVKQMRKRAEKDENYRNAHRPNETCLILLSRQQVIKNNALQIEMY